MFLLLGSTSALLDLSGLDLPITGPSYPTVPTFSGDGSAVPVPEQASSVSLLDDELMSLGESRRCWSLIHDVRGERPVGRHLDSLLLLP